MVDINTECTKYVVVAGGVISGVGKGVATASIGKIIKEHGYKTTLIKIDPYINFDAGTLRPTEHGEVWVTDDGGEIDQDLGTYERFLNQDIPKKNNITTGQIYQSVINRERKGEYLGQTVQFIPHITDEIIRRIKCASKGYDVAIIEIGGTVGDYENVPFLFAFKTLEQELGSDNVAYMLVTYLPVPSHIGEMKTKPTQQAIRLLGEQGIIPDFVICRSQEPLDQVRSKKIQVFGNIPSDHIIAAPDISTIYQMPLIFEQQDLGKKLLSHLKLKPKRTAKWDVWRERVHNILEPKKQIDIAIIGKYLDCGEYSLTDSYLSIDQALIHAGAHHATQVNITWMDSKEFEEDVQKTTVLNSFDGIIIPGGFGASGVEGKIKAISYIRKHKIPFLGLCYGLQLAVIEFARNVCSLKTAHTTEVEPQTMYPVIDILPVQKELLSSQQYGGTMRLGSYHAMVKPQTLVHTLYNNSERVLKKEKHDYLLVSERHRHRYEVNPAYVKLLEQEGLIFSGYHTREDGTRLMEFGELSDHPFFLATQAHPEFTSRFGNPNPLFNAFVIACEERSAHKSSDNHVLDGKTFQPAQELQL